MRTDWMKLAGLALIAGLVIGGCGACGYVIHETSIKGGTVTLTVEGKERIAEGEDGKWMVYATDGQSYQVTDNIFYWRFDATDRYREIEVGKTYECKTVGVRWNFLSAYKNLLDCEEAA